MLISNSVFKKILPERMHLRWDTWANANSSTVLMSTVLGSSTLLVNTTSTAEKSMLALGVLAMNFSLLALKNRREKEHAHTPKQWKEACAHVEAKLGSVVHLPSMYRRQALSDLSGVLRDMYIDHMFSNNQSENEVFDFESNSYVSSSCGSQVNPLLTSTALEKIHVDLNFNGEDVRNWVEASYLVAIHKRSTQKLPYPDQPLPGTTAAIARIANNNPACLAYYVYEYGLDEQDYDDLWEDETGMGWFGQTRWPALIKTLSLVDDESMGLMTMYRQAVQSIGEFELNKEQVVGQGQMQPSFG